MIFNFLHFYFGYRVRQTETMPVIDFDANFLKLKKIPLKPGSFKVNKLETELFVRPRHDRIEENCEMVSTEYDDSDYSYRINYTIQDGVLYLQRTSVFNAIVGRNDSKHRQKITYAFLTAFKPFRKSSLFLCQGAVRPYVDVREFKKRLMVKYVMVSSRGISALRIKRMQAQISELEKFILQRGEEVLLAPDHKWEIREEHGKCYQYFLA